MALHPDHLLMFERFVACAEQREAKAVELPTSLARIILEAAKAAKKPRGRTPLTGREKVRQSTIIALARRRKAVLMGEGIPTEDASERAAEDARLALLPRMVAISTIRRWMD